MFFKVIGRATRTPRSQTDTVFLKIDNWNDYSYFTLFGIEYFDEEGHRYNLGGVRIASYGQSIGIQERRLNEGDEFTTIGNDFFSLGTGTEYYETLNRFNQATRESILSGLKDIAFAPDLLANAEHEEVTKVSLLRGIDIATITGQYHRMAMGGARLTKYRFYFESPDAAPNGLRTKLLFKVTPESNPPTNIHVLIGRNGVGKTRMINGMIASLNGEEFQNGRGIYFGDNDDEKFVNVVSVSFSAFDTTPPLFDGESEKTGIVFRYVGIKVEDGRFTLGFRAKDTEELAAEFVKSFLECTKSFKTDRLKRSLTALESDPNFKEANILQLLNIKKRQFNTVGTKLISKLSSGHKIILLSITKLVETVQEKSLVFIDEPEGHLHPPLLSAFIRSLSELLIHINGVAIIATHSPVILQEVPKHCVYKLRRFGANAIVERPEIETFGENVGVLTREVFGLEVTESGFYQLLKKAVDKLDDYDELLNEFGDSLGMEARALARVLFNQKNKT